MEKCAEYIILVRFEHCSDKGSELYQSDSNAILLQKHSMFYIRSCLCHPARGLPPLFAWGLPPRCQQVDEVVADVKSPFRTR